MVRRERVLKDPIIYSQRINSCRDESALFAAKTIVWWELTGLDFVKRSSFLSSFFSLCSVSLSQESGFTAFYTTIVFAERPRYYMLKIIFYLGTSLTANLDAARGECLAFQALHSAEILSRLSYRVQGCERNGCSMSFTRVLLGRPTFSRTK